RGIARVRRGRAGPAGRRRGGVAVEDAPAALARVAAGGLRLVARDQAPGVLGPGRCPPGLDLDGVGAVADVGNPEARAAGPDRAVVGDAAVGRGDAGAVAIGPVDLAEAHVDLADDLVLEDAAAVERR